MTLQNSQHNQTLNPRKIVVLCHLCICFCSSIAAETKMPVIRPLCQSKALSDSFGFELAEPGGMPFQMSVMLKLNKKKKK